MSTRFTRRHATALALTAVTVAALQGVASPIAGASQPSPSDAAPVSAVGQVEDQTARAVAASLGDQRWRAQIRSAALASDQVDLSALTGRATAKAGQALKSTVAKGDQRIAAAKGLGADTGSLLRLRLAADSMRGALTAGTVPLVAAAGTDDNAETITAYDSRGRAHTLDARTTPDRPVYVVDIDVTKAMAAGLGVVDKELAKHGLSSAEVAEASEATAEATEGSRNRAAAAGFWTSRIDAVYLSNDEEPWVSGDAEIFSIVSGFGFDGKVRVDTVTMPYLDNDGTTYYPNQILVNWSSYKYNLADVVMMEDDGDTNYQALAKAIADILLTITDQGAYIPLVNAILDAIPTSWWTNDPDYVDSWYTLGQNSSGRLNGARGNGWMTISPYFVEQF
ncbi:MULTISPECIES: DUF3103 family protein [unclassified Streptomyces]|uniref:DUF3103 family protein n=1 Tax=unclassified Streptomyces TaxID=2593676 RepID=UPI00081DA474|nr:MULTISPECIES: DUF3103 family protein [unclassified Streptomyces]MYZ34934.1 DUF3103 family protein [Streptomyces sp. SID4917]SCF71482.1 Protein of unknown function [Streptomyces sp. MnatMP-M17]